MLPTWTAGGCPSGQVLGPNFSKVKHGLIDVKSQLSGYCKVKYQTSINHVSKVNRLWVRLITFAQIKTNLWHGHIVRVAVPSTRREEHTWVITLTTTFGEYIKSHCGRDSNESQMEVVYGSQSESQSNSSFRLIQPCWILLIPCAGFLK